MDKKLLATIAAEAINAALKQIDAVTSDDDMNYIVICNANCRKLDEVIL